MTHHITIKMDSSVIGVLNYDQNLNLFSFNYDEKWLSNPRKYQLSPQIPFLRDGKTSNEIHSALVKNFFDNLLPEGQALEDASRAAQVSKSNTIGLLLSIAKETSGAISVGDSASTDSIRKLSIDELSSRINARPEIPFSLWDGKVRLSIAGYQDKISVLKLNDEFYFSEGEKYASTHIIKPDPVSEVMRGMTSNEFFCMRLAKKMHLDVAEVHLIKVPEPVLIIERFDRNLHDDGVNRLHYIDGCQALGLPVMAKYEHLFGDGKDVSHIRDGASYFKLFDLMINSSAPQKTELLKWAIFHVLINNVDAHAKNISFKYNYSGLEMAPAYDLVSVNSLKDKNLDRNYAMAIGDAFSADDLSPYEWANFATACNLPFKLVSSTLEFESINLLRVINEVKQEVIAEGADPKIVDRISESAINESKRQLDMAKEIKKVSKNLFQ